MLEDEPALRAAETLQRATREWWRFTTTSVLELRPMAQEQEREAAALGLLCEGQVYRGSTQDRPSGKPSASSDSERPAEGRAAQDDAGLRTWREQLVSRPPKDGRPGTTIRGGDRRGTPTGSRCDFEQRERARGPGREQRTPSKRPCVRARRPSSYCGDLTFDMSGSRRQAKPAGGCPLDGVVRCPRGARRRTGAANC